MIETWADKKDGIGQEKIYVWEGQKETKKNRRGAMGGINNTNKGNNNRKGNKKELVKEGTMTGRMRYKKENWRIIGVYADRNRLEEKLQTLEK